MVHLRNFCMEDASTLYGQNRFQMSLDAIQDMISEWNTKTWNNRYFEMFAVTNGREIIGRLSLYEHSGSVVSIGPEIFAEHRQQGHACQAMETAIAMAKAKGYQIAFQQVRTDNIASRKLHAKLGFETDGYVYKNQKGRDVLIFLKALA